MRKSKASSSGGIRPSDWESVSRELSRLEGTELSLDEAERLYREAPEERLDETTLRSLVDEALWRELMQVRSVVVGHVMVSQVSVESVTCMWHLSVRGVDGGEAGSAVLLPGSDFSLRIDSTSVDLRRTSDSNRGERSSSRIPLNITRDDRDAGSGWMLQADTGALSYAESCAAVAVGVGIEGVADGVSEGVSEGVAAREVRAGEDPPGSRGENDAS